MYAQYSAFPLSLSPPLSLFFPAHTYTHGQITEGMGRSRSSQAQWPSISMFMNISILLLCSLSFPSNVLKMSNCFYHRTKKNIYITPFGALVHIKRCVFALFPVDTYKQQMNDLCRINLLDLYRNMSSFDYPLSPLSMTQQGCGSRINI